MALEVLRKRGVVGQGRLGQQSPAGNGGFEGARLGQEARRQDNGAVGPVVVIGRAGLATSGGNMHTRRDGEDVLMGPPGRQ